VTLDQEGANKHIDKRILVLGSAPHTRLVTAYTWDNLPKLLNVADYDVAILNLEPLWDKELAGSVKPEMLPSIEQFARLLFSHESEIIIIGYPEIRIGGKSSNVPATWWFPIFPRFVYDPGDAIRDVDPEFTYYFQYVREWSFFATSDCAGSGYPLPHYLRLVAPQADDLSVSLKPIAQTRFQKPIAFRLRFQIVRTIVPEQLRQTMMALKDVPSSLKKTEILKESGNVIWLPRATKISDYDAVDLILKERYGLQFEQAPPQWVAAYKLPEQIPIEEEISHHEQEIQRLKNELTTAQQRLQDVSRFRKLLYEQHVDGLEPVVRDALRELGATVSDPPPKENREDGRLTVPAGQIGMLEIKGRTKSLALADVRQLDQWVRDALIQENLESKGILIANMYCGQPPELRNNPFPPNCIDSAKRANLCLMTTTQLFRALCSHQREELDVAEFWNTVFNTDGVCPLPELEPPGSEQSSDASSTK
jgi:hypothetical protein